MGYKNVKITRHIQSEANATNTTQECAGARGAICRATGGSSGERRGGAAARNLREKYWIGDVTKDETVEGGGRGGRSRGWKMSGYSDLSCTWTSRVSVVNSAGLPRTRPACEVDRRVDPRHGTRASPRPRARVARRGDVPSESRRFDIVSHRIVA